MGSKKDRQITDVIELVAKYGTIAKAAEATGIARTTLRDRYHAAKNGGTCPQEIKLNRLAETAKQAEQKNRQLLEALQEKTDQLERILDVQRLLHKHHIQKITADKDVASQSVACMVGSDWHIEEQVRPEIVSGLNEFNLDIAERRVRAFFANGMKLVDMCRSKSTIDTLVLAILGDLITGYIHEEYTETNALSPTQAILKVYGLLCAGIDFLAGQGFKRIIVPMSIGNHGRTTLKPRVSTAAANSYEWLLYMLVAARYDKHPIVQIVVSEGYHNYLTIYDQVVRFHHGNAIRYNGGVGGIHIPLNKAIAQWNKARHADLDIMGHWHTRMSAANYVVNGSIIGYNAFGIHIKADFQPPQQAFFLMHPRWGKTVEAPIIVE